MYSPISTNTRRHSLATSGAPNFKFPSQRKYIETLSHSPTMVLLLDDTMKDMYDEQLRMPSSFSNRAKVDPQSSQPSDEPTTIDSDENIVSDEMVRQVNHANAISGKPSDTIHLSSSKDDFDTALERECQICFEKFDALQTQVCVICNGSFCMTCMRWYIEFKINEGEVSSKKLVCPASLCTRPLTQDLIEAFVTPEHFTKYQLFLSNQQPGIRFCPRAGCSTVIDEPLHTRTRRVMCSSCKNESCMRCGNDFHKLPTCTRNGRRFGRWKKRHNVRACPGCTTDIEKQGGCSHMKCFQCDHEFCWGCLRPWETHDENLCIPLAFFRSKNPKYGPIAPVRVMTKTVIVGAAAVVVVTGASVAVVVVPSILLFQWAKTSIQRRAHRHSNKYANDYDLV